MKLRAVEIANAIFTFLLVAVILLAPFSLSGCNAISVSSQPSSNVNQSQSAGSNALPIESSPSEEKAALKTDKQLKNEEPSEGFTDDVDDDGLLIDFRSELAFDLPKLSPAKGKQILQAVYGAGVDAGDFEINSVEDESFTQPEARETAYLIQAGGPRAADPSSLEKTQLVIFADQKLIAKYDLSDYNFILRTSDLDQDGKAELLLSGSNYQMGESIVWAKLVEVEDNRLQDFKNFKTVLVDSCDNPHAQPQEIKAALIKYNPENPSQISSSYFSAPCSAKEDDKRYPDMFNPIAEESIGEN